MEPNGVITEYMIIYEFNDRLCRGHGNKIRENKTITDIVIVSMNTSYVLDKLHPFWNYTILIKASNSKGYGPVSSNGTFITSEAGLSIYFCYFPKQNTMSRGSYTLVNFV